MGNKPNCEFCGKRFELDEEVVMDLSTHRVFCTNEQSPLEKWSCAFSYLLTVIEGIDISKGSYVFIRYGNWFDRG